MRTQSYKISGVFGYMTVLDASSGRKILCRCSCGVEKWVDRYGVKNGHIRSCGCKRLELYVRSSGISYKTEDPLYPIWASMKQRCDNINSQNYADYGGRGINYCERWAVFENFVSDMGKRECSSYSLDRIDNDGDYNPENCRWSSRRQQAYNKRSNVRVSLFNTIFTLADIEDITGMSRGLIYGRIKNYNMTAMEAIMTKHRNSKGVNFNGTKEDLKEKCELFKQQRQEV